MSRQYALARREEPPETPFDFSHLEIDPHRLDEEWVEQPRRYFLMAQGQADARMRWEEAKNRLEVVRAEIDRDIRRDPAAYGIAKLTESAIESTIPLQAKYERARHQVVEAKHEYDIWDAGLGALDHKKKGLENLVQLHLSSYYAKPREPEDNREAMEEMTKQRIRRRGQQPRKT